MSQPKVAVVTGSNKGIGCAIVKELCSKFDGIVYLTSRNESRGLAATQELNQEGLHPMYHQLDIDDEKSVVALRDYLKDTYGGLDVLVNNAGVLNVGGSFGEDATRTVRTNFFSTLRTCDILFPILKAHGRVVNVSSSMGHMSMITGQGKATMELRQQLTSDSLTKDQLCQLMQNFVDAANKEEHDQYGWPDNYYIASKTGLKIVPRMHKPLAELGSPEDMIMKPSYIVSKIGVSALTRIQQRQFDQDPREDLIVNCVHPGYVSSDMTSHKGISSIEHGASAPCWLALLPENVPGPKGAYVWDDRKIVDWVDGPCRLF